MLIRIQNVLFLYLLPVIFLLFINPPSSSVAAPIGICYGRVTNIQFPSPSTIVKFLNSNGINNIRIFDADPTILKSFSGTAITLIVGVPNQNLPFLANANINTSIEWLQSNIFSHIPANQIKYIAVGNEVFLKDQSNTPYLIPAMLNLYQALLMLNLNNIKLSSPQASSILSISYPPSSGTFDPYLDHVMKPFLQFLYDSRSPLMVNVYPYISYVNNLKQVQLDYALFKSKRAVQDGAFKYNNLFAATIDAFLYAMEKDGYPGIQVVVTETGWPTAGGEGANVKNALAYNGEVVRQIMNNVGTPKRPKEGMEAYLFGLFDENGKGEEEYEKHFGIFGLDGNKAYNLSFNW
ncbi:hypothetical protein JCGZ_17752 [Jatropha curcas]|uniref:glucan endo-1,3-beta-D-glucosidase n=1 Tax=Jatropha curcas TaxID=180498 RepID=A0A067K472_JATCU|nr:glucan endo-1,3-beta-glucosidase, acidic [Jatropha curcas]KDP26594.1 hypothetical protein JCGZ_17752 [Jatropha curcas]